MEIWPELYCAKLKKWAFSVSAKHADICLLESLAQKRAIWMQDQSSLSVLSDLYLHCPRK